MKRNYSFFLLFFFASTLNAQILQDNLSPKKLTFAANALLTPSKQLATLAISQLEREDELNDKLMKPWRFAEEEAVDVDWQNTGTHTENNGVSIWQYQLACVNAVSLNYFFDSFYLPPSAKLFVVNNETGAYFGAICAENNNTANQLLTWPFKGSKHTLQLEVASNEAHKVKLHLSTVAKGYRDFDKAEQGQGDSGPCNVNVACAAADPWAMQKKAVVVILSGSNGICTGTLLNNTTNNGRPFVLTANHCRSSSTQNWSFRFNFQSDECANNTLTGPIQSINGNKILAANAKSDFMLLEMNTKPPAAFNAYYAGWNKNESQTSPKQATLHHPRGDLKKVSVNTNPVTAGLYLENENIQTWKIDKWEVGTTEGGSSGASLFDAKGLVIGQLTGGKASCATRDSSDYFGRLGVSFLNTENDSSTTLSYWLDPSLSGTDTVSGFDPNGPLAALDIAIQQVSGVSTRICGTSLMPSIDLVNNGSAKQDDVKLLVYLDGNLVFEKLAISLESKATTRINLPAISVGGGTHLLKIIAQNSSNTDASPYNNESNISLTSFPDGNKTSLKIVLDDFGSENSWKIKDSNGLVIAFGGPYQDNAQGTTINTEVCLSPACYVLDFADKFGDGMCCDFGNGSYSLSDVKNKVLANGWSTPPSSTEKELIESTPFCVDPTGIAELNAKQLSFFPNPSTGSIQLSGLNATPFTLRVYDLLGKEVRLIEQYSASEAIDLSKLVKGVYTLVVTQDAINYRGKLVLQ